MKKTGFCLAPLVLALLGFLSACASFGFDTMVNDTTKAGVIISGDDLEEDESVNIFIDNIRVGKIRTQEIKGYVLKNGNHTIYFTGKYEYDGELKKSTARRITVNNDRHHFSPFIFITLDDRYDDVPEPVKQEIKVDGNLFNTAIENSFNTILKNMPKDSKIAIVNISAPNKDDSSYILEELTVLFVNSQQFTVVDRQTLEAIKKEQNFQLSGEVSDESIISIGNFIGADVVITGSISGDGERRRLRLQALNVKTAQVLAMSSERI